MGRIESLSASPIVRCESDGAEPAWSRRPPELFELLAEGHPPAFAIDSRERIVFWNRGAAALLEKRAEDVMGRRCFDVLCGRDVWGNRFCSASCPVVAMARQDEPVSAFEVRTTRDLDGSSRSVTLNVTLIRIPGPRPDLFTLVHILQEIDEEARAARALAVCGEESPSPSPRPLRSPAAEPLGPPGPAVLTPREKEILHWVATGLQNKEIAVKLDLSLATVRNHIHNTLVKLGVHSKLEAVSLAFRSGWVLS